MLCPKCKKRIAEDDKFCGYCGQKIVKQDKVVDLRSPAREVFNQEETSQKQVPEEASLNYANFGIRFGAFVLDYGLMFLVLLGLVYFLDLTWSDEADTIVGLIFLVVYHTFFLSIYSSTPGKLLFGLKVIDEKTKKNITFGKALGRSLSYILSSFIFGLGFWTIAFDKPRHQGWHDKIAKTLVVQRKKRPLSLLVILSIISIIIIGFFIYFIYFAPVSEYETEEEYFIPELTQDQISAVVFLVCPDDNYDYNEFISFGSGVIVNSDEGNIFTNRHVVTNEDWSIIESSPTCYVAVTDNISQPPKLMYLADLAAYSPQTDEYFDFDIAVLDIYDVCPRSECEDAPLSLPFSFPFIESGYSEDLTPGSYVSIIGYPEIGGETWSFTEGTVSGRIGDFVIKTDAKIDAGNSGGAALNIWNQLIGIPTWVIIGEAESMGYIIDIDSIFEWYENKAIPSETLEVPFK